MDPVSPPPTWVALAGKAFETVDWWVPPYFQGGSIRKLAATIDSALPVEKHSVLEAALARMYDAHYVAAMLFERYPAVPPVSEFRVQIREALEAFALGLPHAAIATLLPVLEGIVRKVANADSRDLGMGTQKLVTEVDRLADQHHGDEADREIRDMLKQLSAFMSDRLLKNTSSYYGIGALNRHGILHGLFTDYGAEYNFHKLVSFLDTLVFVLSMKTNGVSIFAPVETRASRKFAIYLRSLSAVQRLRPTGAIP